MADPVSSSDEAIEAAARAEYEHRRDVEEAEWERGRWERLDPAHRERYLKAARRAVASAEPIIAARVRAEAVAEVQGWMALDLWMALGRDSTEAPDPVFGEWAEMLAAVRAGAAGAVAADRQRIATEIALQAEKCPEHWPMPKGDCWLCQRHGVATRCARIAAGSVPVATSRAEGAVIVERGSGTPVDRLLDFVEPGPVATPEPEWRTTTGRLLGRPPRSTQRRPIDRHPCGCVTGWDDVHEQCVLTRCAQHSPVATPTEPAGSIYDELRAERERAHAKHGDTSMEAWPADSLERLTILLEEVGECAKEFNDARHDARPVNLAALRKELVQTATMAAAWADRIGAASPVPAEQPQMCSCGRRRSECGRRQI